MDTKLVPKFKDWKGYPPRSIKWAQHTFPMKVGIEYSLSTNDSDSEPPKKGYVQILKANRKRFWQFLKDNNIEPNIYEKTLGNYEDWLKNESE